MGFGELAAKYAKTPNKSLFAAFFMGLLIFVDDFLNAMAVGGAMRNLTDKFKIPREALGLAVNYSGSPVCVLIPLSTWSIFFIGLLENQNILYEGSAQAAYIHSMPFMLYASISLLVGGLFCMGVLPKLGYMKKAYERTALETVFNENRDKNSIHTEKNANIIDFIIPMIVLIFVAIYTGDVVVGCLSTVVVCGLLYIPRKIMAFVDFLENVLQGILNMLPVMLVILFIYVLLGITEDMMLTEYVLDLALPYMNAYLLPAMTFVLIAILAFFTASYWEVVTISVPIIIPMALALGVNPFLTVGALISGSLFGCHACFYADVFVVVSQAIEVKPMNLFKAQLPYVIISAVISVVCFTILGFIM